MILNQKIAMMRSILKHVQYLEGLPTKLQLPLPSVPKVVNATFSRKYSTPIVQNVKPHTFHSLFQPEVIETYKALYPVVMETVLQEASKMPEVAQRLKTVTSRMLPNDWIIEGIKVPTLYKMLDSPEKKTQEKLFLSGILGWCADLTIASFIIRDDLMDHDDTRFGNPCLHKYEDVQTNEAVNFVTFLDNAPYYLLKEFCSQYPWYTSCLELTRLLNVKACYGNFLEEMNTRDGKPIFERFTRENNRLYLQCKGGPLAVVKPLMYAMFASGNYDLAFPQIAGEVCEEIGKFLSIQDDMVDYEIPKQNMSLTCDVSEGKCTWLVMQVLEKGTKAQKDIIYKHYGKKNIGSVKIINKLYEDFGMFDLYEEYKQKSYDFVWERTKTLPIKEEHRQLLWNYIDFMYEKQK